MIKSVLGLFKVWLITKVALSPWLWIGILILFSAFILFLAIFVKFKNGFLSLVCFLLCEGLGVAALVALLSNNVYYDNLYLGERTTQQFSDVTPDGIVYRKLFRTVSEPLLGIALPKEGMYFDQAKELILNSRFSDSLYMYRSSAYSGVVLCDSENHSINEQLLYDGLAKTTKVTPKQYTHIQQGSIKARRGMWAISAVPVNKPSILLEFTIVWLALILCVSTSVALTTWLRKIVKIYSL